MDSSFRSHIVDILHLCEIDDEFIDLHLSDDALQEFLKSYTHKTFDPINNYEEREFLGDPSVNECIVYYIRKRWPFIKSPKWLTRIKHNLVSGKMLARIGLKIGIYKYIRTGPILPMKKNAKQSFNKQDALNILLKGGSDMSKISSATFEEIWDEPEVFSYLSIIEDVIESLCATIILFIEDTAKQYHGTAVEAIHRFLPTLLDREEISIKYEDVFDPISRLKELYESNIVGYKWKFNESMEIINPSPDSWIVKVYGWTNGSSNPKVFLAEHKGRDKDATRSRASRKALAVLDTKGFKEKIANPTER